MTPRPGVASDVARALRALCSGTSTHTDIDRLIALAAAIVQRRMRGRLGAAARVEGVTEAQVATSIIGGLFAPAGPECPLAKSLAEHLAEDDDSLFLRFGAVVVGAASQELFHRWRENDPLSARLWRNLHRALRHSDRLVAFPARRPRWVTLAGDGPRDTHLPAPGRAELAPLVRLHSAGSGAIGDVVVKVLGDVERLAHCSKVASIDLLFALIREETRELAAAEMNAATAHEDAHPVLQMAVTEARAAAVGEVVGRVAAYLESGKLSAECAGHMEQALKDIVADCADGGPAQSYYEYVRAHAPDLEMAEYRRDWRTRFEYLAETAREHFFDGVRARLGAKILQEPPVAPKNGRKERGSRL